MSQPVLGPMRAACPRCGLVQPVELWSTPRKRQCEQCRGSMLLPSAIDVRPGAEIVASIPNASLFRVAWAVLALCASASTIVYMANRMHPAAWPALAVGMTISLLMLTAALWPPRRMGLLHLWIAVGAIGLVGIVWMRVEQAPERLREDVLRSERARLGAPGAGRTWDLIGFDGALARAGHGPAVERLMTVVRERRPGFARATAILAERAGIVVSRFPVEPAMQTEPIGTYSAARARRAARETSSAWEREMERIGEMARYERGRREIADDDARRIAERHASVPGGELGFGLAERFELAMAERDAELRVRILEEIGALDPGGLCRQHPADAKAFTDQLAARVADDPDHEVRRLAAGIIERIAGR